MFTISIPYVAPKASSHWTSGDWLYFPPAHLWRPPVFVLLVVPMRVFFSDAKSASAESSLCKSAPLSAIRSGAQLRPTVLQVIFKSNGGFT